jgi:hypothetical protein
MTLSDAVDVIETVGGALLGMSGIAFILLGLLAENRRQSAVKQDYRNPIVRLVARNRKSSPADNAADREAA